MEPSAAVKRYFPILECWSLKAPGPEDIKAAEDLRTAAKSLSHSKHRRGRFTQRHRIYPMMESGWNDSLKDHLRMPLWPVTLACPESYVVGFWAALCLRPEIYRVELCQDDSEAPTVCRIRMEQSHIYVCVLDLLNGPLNPPGRHSFRFLSLFQLVQHEQSVSGLGRMIHTNPESWHVTVTWRDETKPAVLLRWPAFE